MVDSPKAFLTIIIAFVIALSVIITATREFKEEQNIQGTFNVTIKEPEITAPTKKTTTTKTAVAPTKPKTTSSTSVTPNVKTDYTVTYIKTGFSPRNLTIAAGKSVRFLNQSSGSMYIKASPSPNQGPQVEFDQGRSVGKDGYYDFTFNRKGSFVYYNNNLRTHAGVIVVE